MFPDRQHERHARRLSSHPRQYHPFRLVQSPRLGDQAAAGPSHYPSSCHVAAVVPWIFPSRCPFFGPASGTNTPHDCTHARTVRSVILLYQTTTPPPMRRGVVCVPGTGCVRVVSCVCVVCVCAVCLCCVCVVCVCLCCVFVLCVLCSLVFCADAWNGFNWGYRMNAGMHCTFATSSSLSRLAFAIGACPQRRILPQFPPTNVVQEVFVNLAVAVHGCACRFLAFAARCRRWNVDGGYFEEKLEGLSPCSRSTPLP